MEVQISNQQETICVDNSFMEECQEMVSKVWPCVFTYEGDVSIVFVDDETIAKLNEHYRGKNSTTDVLSFPLEDQTIDNGLVGEIVISLPQAQTQAEEYKNSLLEEVSFLIVHGLLHLAGYDHDEEHRGEMRQKEKEIMSQIIPH